MSVIVSVLKGLVYLVLGDSVSIQITEAVAIEFAKLCWEPSR